VDVAEIVFGLGPQYAAVGQRGEPDASLEIHPGTSQVSGLKARTPAVQEQPGELDRLCGIEQWKGLIELRQRVGVITRPHEQQRPLRMYEAPYGRADVGNGQGAIAQCQIVGPTPPGRSGVGQTHQDPGGQLVVVGAIEGPVQQRASPAVLSCGTLIDGSTMKLCRGQHLSIITRFEPPVLPTYVPCQAFLRGAIQPIP
jgi:hypothetical protein